VPYGAGDVLTLPPLSRAENQHLEHRASPSGLLAELRLAVMLCTYKRHRVETYGLAKPGAVQLVDKAEVDALDVEEGRRCPHCGGPMAVLASGRWGPHGYSWTREGAGRDPTWDGLFDAS